MAVDTAVRPEQQQKPNNYIIERGQEKLSRGRQDYLKNRWTLKVIDTLIAAVAIMNGILSYVENEYFRMEVVEDGVIVKN